MIININNKKYTIEEEINLYQFLIDHGIIYNLPDQLAFVEVKGFDELVNSKDFCIYENVEIYTNSKKVNEHISKVINNNLIDNNLYQNISLDPECYNILLCEADCYNACFEKYKEYGFNDIINDKFAQMIYIIEATHQLLHRVSKRIDYKTRVPLVVIQRGLVKYPKKYNVNLKPIDEIAAELIKKYYKEILKVNQKINIIYVTSSISQVLSYNIDSAEYERLVDNIVLMNNFDVNKLENNKFDSVFSKNIYIKENEFLNQSCNYNSIFMILHQMGFIQEELDISTTELGKNVIVKYNDLELNFLFTDKYLTEEEIKNSEYDMILVSTKNTTLSPNQEENVLSEYNINQIYRKIIIRPGNKTMFRRY